MDDHGHEGDKEKVEAWLAENRTEIKNSIAGE